VGERNKIVSMTGGGIHELASHIAQYIGAEAVDGFKHTPNDDEIVCVVINCGGTLRCGIYPQKNLFTINLNAIGPAGPLAGHITEDLYVSGVKKKNVSYEEGKTNLEKKEELPDVSEEEKEDSVNNLEEKEEKKGNPVFNLLSKLGSTVASVVSMFLDSGRKTVDLLLKTIIPFMAFVSILIAFVEYTGIGNAIANILSPLGSSLWGLLLISIICSFPFLSPLLGPGAAVAQVVGVLVGTLIGAGEIPVQYALPALFAIDSQ